MVFGLVPALQATRFELATVIRDEAGGGGRTRGRLRQALVAGQVAVSVVLLVAAGLFVRSLDAARSTDPGFGSGNIGLAWVATSTPIDSSGAIRLLRERLSAMPGVEKVGFSDNIAMNLLSTSSLTVTVNGVEPPPGQEGFDIDKTSVDTGFFGAAGYRLLRGRNFTLTDADSAPMVTVVNQAFVDKFQLRKVSLLGNSTGGRVVQVYAGLHPERVDKLVVEDVGPERPRRFRPAQWNRQCRRANWPDISSRWSLRR